MSTQKILIILGNIVILLALNEISQNIESLLKKLSVRGFVFTCHLNALREARETYVRRSETTQRIIMKDRILDFWGVKANNVQVHAKIRLKV